MIAAIGVLPAFAMLWYAERFERRVREPNPGWRYRILAASGFAALPIGLIEFQLAAWGRHASEPHKTLYEAFVVAAATEEILKFTCLWLLTRAGLRPGTRYGAFLYALHAAMGFAAVENVVALISAPDLAELTGLLLLRTYLAIPTHLFAGGIVGFFWAKRRFDGGGLRLPAGIALAILVHGAYNSMVSSVERLPKGMDLMLNAYALGAMAIPLVGVFVLHALAHHLVALDRADGR
ncbi:MAG: PrsW family glutamic-type intramembrane protease [Myxococcales bacterium]|nr:PrsW family glutamic-type intramembrane protease [Myxococcales bacterium]